MAVNKVTNNLTNINFLSETQYNSLEEISPQELYMVKAGDYVTSYGIGSGYWYQEWASGIKEIGGISQAGFAEVEFPFEFNTTTYSLITQPVVQTSLIAVGGFTGTTDEFRYYAKGY